MFPDWRVDDLVTHGYGDVHKVLWTDAEEGEMPDEVEVLCVWPSRDGTYSRGDRERNVVWAFTLVKRHLPEPEEAPPIRKRA